MRCLNAAIGCLIFVCGCANATEPDSTVGPAAGGNVGAGGGSGGASVAVDAGFGGGVVLDGGQDPPDACAAASLEAKIEKRPLDIVIYVDWSDSMGNAVNAIQKSFDQSFSQSMVASGIDYRVIMIAPKSFVANPADPSRY